MAVPRGGTPSDPSADVVSYRALLDLTPDIVFCVDAVGRCVVLSGAFTTVTGRVVDDWIGESFEPLVHQNDLPLAVQRFTDVLRGHSPAPFIVRIRDETGTYSAVEVRARPWQVSGRTVGAAGTAHPLSVGAEAADRERRQEALADFGRQALHASGLQVVLDEAVHVVARGLGVQYASLLRMLPGGQEMQLVSAHGWPGSAIGIVLPVGPNSQAGYTLLSGVPIVVNDLEEETRFGVHPEIAAAGIRSSISAPIEGRATPTGVLSALSTRLRPFLPDEVSFLQSVSAIVAITTYRFGIEGELQQSRDRLEVILEGVGDGITVTEQGNRLIYANAAAARICGYSSPAEMLSVSGAGLFSRFSMFDRNGNALDPDELPGRRLLRGETAVPMEIRFLDRSTGEERWALVNATAGRDGRGNAQLAINVFQDITEHRRADQVLQELADLVESSSDSIIGLTRHAIIRSWNAGARQLYGYTAAEMLGKPFSVLVPPDRVDEIDRGLDRLIAGEPIPPFETVRVTKTGVRLDVLVSLSAIHDASGRFDGVSVITHDISQRKRVQAERSALLLREEEARNHGEAAQGRFAFLAEASEILAGSLDYETTLLNVARLAVPSLADWCTIDVLEEDGSMRRVALTHPDPDKVRWAADLAQRYPPSMDEREALPTVLRERTSLLIPAISDEMLQAGAQDEHHLQLLRELGFTSAMIVPLVARDRALGAISFVAAESGKHFSPDDLALAEDLARRASVAVDNSRLYQQAQEALRLREEFLSIASHELKTPLTALQLQLQMLERAIGREGAEPGERVPRLIDGARRQIRRLSRLVGDLLDVSRITAGRYELDVQRVDLGALVREVVERFGAESSHTGSSITVHAKGDVVGMWDRFQLDQVVTNLLSNALKYGKGKPVEVTMEAQAGIVRIAVHDRGIGIPREHLDRVFDRFERVKLSRNYGGLGLGLYIARQIVEAHGGTITAVSDAARGTTFTVELPL